MADITLPGVNLREQKIAPRSFWEDAGRRIRQDRLTVLALLVLLGLAALSAVGPPLVENALHVDATETHMGSRYLPPSQGHPLGTDQLGRDQFIRILYGGRISLSIALGASFMSIVVGVAVGTVTGYYGGVIDDWVTWFISTISAIPALFLLLIAATIWTPSPLVLVLILAFFAWIETARLVRGQVVSLREREYIVAARALGASNRWIIFHHVLPNILPVVIISLTINAGALILSESGLSFLGLGVQPPTPTWGNMLTDARSYFVKGTHLVLWPGLLITLTVLCLYVLGDGLRDAFDPRSTWR
jgi:ABC-type dipeptide/oligopeptide/nickel transport system permease subunit